MAKNSEYWRERFQQLEDAMHSESEGIARYIIKQYQIALRQMDKELALWYQRFAENNGIDFAEAKRLLNTNELPEFRLSVSEYMAIAQQESLSDEWKHKLDNAYVRVRVSRMESLQLALQNCIERLFKKQEITFNKELPSVYNSSYYHTAFEIQKGFEVGYTFQGIDEKKLKAVVLRPWASDDKNFIDRIAEHKKNLISMLNLEMTQAVIRGDDYRAAATNLTSRMGISQRAAMKLVMTESAYVASQAQHDCFKNLDVEQYEFIATLDRHTSEICRSMDRKHFKMSDFKPGTTAPPMHPNCRSCTAPYFGDEEDIGRAARNLGDGKTFHVAGDMSYKEWRDKISATKKEYFKTHDGWWKGRKRSPEQCKAISKRMKGKWAGDKNPRHINPLNGELNGRWKGGILDTYVELRSDTKDWKIVDSEDGIKVDTSSFQISKFSSKIISTDKVL